MGGASRDSTGLGALEEGLIVGEFICVYGGARYGYIFTVMFGDVLVFILFQTLVLFVWEWIKMKYNLG